MLYWCTMWQFNLKNYKFEMFSFHNGKVGDGKQVITMNGNV